MSRIGCSRSAAYSLRADMLVAMLASAAAGALGGYKLGGARGRSSKGARYASVEAGE